MTSPHHEIQAFLQANPIPCEVLPDIRKAGIVPFLRSPLKYYVMTPIAKKLDLGMPEFQICKGTRMFKSETGWQDMRGIVPTDAELEPLRVTAIREGIEELGLVLNNISTLIALGAFRFTSATNRKEVNLWLCAAEMKNAEHFLPQAEVASSTAQREWLTLAEFKKHGRADHAHILGQIEERLG